MALSAWSLLDACKVPGRARDAVVAAGGPDAVLQAGRVVVTTRGRADVKAFDVHDGRRRQALLEPFLHAGGRVVDDDDNLARLRGRAPVLCLYAGGGLALSSVRPAIAIVGARDADAHGLRAARLLAQAATSIGAVVVSGGARGVDRAAHEAAVDAGGRTIAVLGDPARAPLLTSTSPLVRALLPHADRAAWVTPYGPWCTPHKAMHVERNAITVALSDLVVVVQGAMRSGTADAAIRARRLGTRLCAVVGPAQQELSFIPHGLIAQGVATAIDVDDASLPDVLATLLQTVPPRPHALPLPFAPARATCGIDADDDDDSTALPLLRLLRGVGGSLLLDDAARRLHVPVAQVLADAVSLELDGVLRRDGALLVVNATRHAAHGR